MDMNRTPGAPRARSVWVSAGASLVALSTVVTLTLGAGAHAATVRAGVHRAAARPIAGTFTEYLAQSPETLDPAHMSLAAEDDIAAEIGASLVTINPQGKVVPWLAKSWTFSNHGKTVTFTLRSGVTFQVSHAPLTAQDIVATYERDMAPKTGSPVAADELEGVTSITAPNASTVVFHLKAPNGSFLENISDSGYLAPVDPVELKKWGSAYGQHPSSVGPYMLESWVPGESVTLVRNPNYTWAPSYDDPGAPYLKYLKFLIIPQQSSQVAAFASGQVDELGVPPQLWNQYATNAKYAFYTAADGFVMTFDWNLSEPMFKRALVREALAYAIDRKAIVSAIYQGHALPAMSPYGPNLYGYDGALTSDYPYNPAKAKALLKEAGYTYNSAGQLTQNGQPIVLNFLSESTFPLDTTGQLIQAELQAVGIQSKITDLELSTQIAEMTAGKYDVAMFGYSWSGADPVTLLQILLTNAGGLNVTHFQNQGYANLMNEYVESTSQPTRLELVHEIQADFVKYLPFLPLTYELGGTAVSKNYGGIEWNPWSSSILLDNAYEK